MPPTRWFFRAAFFCALAWVGHAPALSGADRVDWEKEVLPILDGACFKCHSAQSKKAKGDIRLDDLAAIRAKSRSDNLVFPHKPEKSLLYKVINLPAGADDIMPPADQNKALTAPQVALVKTWIEQGANFGEWKSAVARERPVAVEQEAIKVADVAATAHRIDELIEASLSKQKRTFNPPASEEVWCRRVYLDLIGRIPTFDEIQAFLSSRESRKRTKLIDTLLASDGHVSTMYNYWCDALRARDRLAENVRGGFYLNYLKTSVRANKPYDQWVREMVSPEGELETSPAVGYQLRDLGNRFASVDSTASIFLGTQIGCAQCHDHPYDKWTRRDYHQFAAWMTGLEAKRLKVPEKVNMEEGEMESVKMKLEAEAERRTTQRRMIERKLALEAFQRLSAQMEREPRPNFAVRNGRETSGKLPADYQYPDGKPNAAITPAVLFGEAKGAVGQRPADAFAAWLTAADNPRFALTIANRMWARLFGAPFAGPIDGIREVEDCANPALAAYLARLMVAAKFDLRQFQRIVVHTRAYAAQSGTLAGPGAAWDFAGPVLRRMSAEQAWDSLMALAVPDLDKKISYAPPEKTKEADEDEPDDADEIMAKVRATAKFEAREVYREMRHPPRPERTKKPPYVPGPEFGALLRASELPQPAPEAHFLRVFGQSNREIADGGWRSGTVPQTLLMLNSTLFDALVQRGTPLTSAMTRSAGDSDRLRGAYLSILGRNPTLDDMRLISGAFGGTGNTEAIAHTLLGTRQFLFIQ